MKPHTYQKEGQYIIGVVNYYRNMCPSWSHTLSPLTIKTFNTHEFRWTKTKEYSFD